MNNIKIKAGQLILGTVLSWLAISFLAYATADVRGEVNIVWTLLQITFYFSLLLSVETYLSMLLNPQWVRVNLGMVLLFCAPALAYITWYVTNIIF